MSVEIIRIRLAMSNAYLVRDRKTILVDTGKPGDAVAILHAMRKQGLAPSDIALIVLTHAHSDHAGNCLDLKRETGAAVALGRGDIERAGLGRNGQLLGTSIMSNLVRPFVDKPFAPFSPDVIPSTGMSLDAYGVAATIVETPGHTQGSISIICDNGEAIIGDALMGGYMGGQFLPQMPGPHYFVEDRCQNLESLDRVLAAQPSKLHVGHGGPLSFADVVKWRNGVQA